MTLTSGSALPSSSSHKNSTANNSGHRQEQEKEQQEQRDLDLPSAAALLDSLAPRLRALLAQNPLRVPLGGLKVMQPDPARAHVLYAEPDLRSPDGRRLRAVCGACCCSTFFFERIPYFLPFHPPVSFPLERIYVPLIGPDFLELVYGAFTEAGFLTDGRPLKVCCPNPWLHTTSHKLGHDV